MSLLSDAAERYRNILDELDKRLQPVLMAVPSDPKGVSDHQPKPGSGVELGDAIEAQVSFINTNTERLQYLLGRLEI